MSFNPVTGGLGTVNQVGSTATGNIQSVADKPVKQLKDTTQPIVDPIIPGQFPSDTPQNETQAEISFSSIWTTICAWFSSLAPRAFDAFESTIKWLVNWLLPPPRQAQLYEAALKRPIASTFIICQLICCGVPILVFLAGVFIFAVVGILLWAVLSFLILGPILLVASLMGISLWGWGWIIYGLVKWVDQRFLGGLITRFWLPRQPVEGDEKKDGKDRTD